MYPALVQPLLQPQARHARAGADRERLLVEVLDLVEGAQVEQDAPGLRDRAALAPRAAGSGNHGHAFLGGDREGRRNLLGAARLHHHVSDGVAPGLRERHGLPVGVERALAARFLVGQHGDVPEPVQCSI